MLRVARQKQQHVNVGPHRGPEQKVGRRRPVCRLSNGLGGVRARQRRQGGLSQEGGAIAQVGYSALVVAEDDADLERGVERNGLKPVSA